MVGWRKQNLECTRELSPERNKNRAVDGAFLLNFLPTTALEKRLRKRSVCVEIQHSFPFLESALLNYPGWTQACSTPASASHSSGITGMCHHTYLLCVSIPSLSYIFLIPHWVDQVLLIPLYKVGNSELWKSEQIPYSRITEVKLDSKYWPLKSAVYLYMQVVLKNLSDLSDKVIFSSHIKIKFWPQV